MPVGLTSPRARSTSEIRVAKPSALFAAVSAFWIRLSIPEIEATPVATSVLSFCTSASVVVNVLLALLKNVSCAATLLFAASAAVLAFLAVARARSDCRLASTIVAVFGAAPRAASAFFTQSA